MKLTNSNYQDIALEINFSKYKSHQNLNITSCLSSENTNKQVFSLKNSFIKRFTNNETQFNQVLIEEKNNLFRSDKKVEIKELLSILKNDDKINISIENNSNYNNLTLFRNSYDFLHQQDIELYYSNKQNNKLIDFANKLKSDFYKTKLSYSKEDVEDLLTSFREWIKQRFSIFFSLVEEIKRKTKRLINKASGRLFSNESFGKHNNHILIYMSRFYNDKTDEDSRLNNFWKTVKVKLFINLNLIKCITKKNSQIKLNFY